MINNNQERTSARRARPKASRMVIQRAGPYLLYICTFKIFDVHLTCESDTVRRPWRPDRNVLADCQWLSGHRGGTCCPDRQSSMSAATSLSALPHSSAGNPSQSVATQGALDRFRRSGRVVLQIAGTPGTRSCCHHIFAMCSSTRSSRNLRKEETPCGGHLCDFPRRCYSRHFRDNRSSALHQQRDKEDASRFATDKFISRVLPSQLEGRIPVASYTSLFITSCTFHDADYVSLAQDVDKSRALRLYHNHPAHGEHGMYCMQ